MSVRRIYAMVRSRCVRVFYMEMHDVCVELWFLTREASMSDLREIRASSSVYSWGILRAISHIFKTGGGVDQLVISTKLLRLDRQMVAWKVECASLCRMWLIDLPFIVGGGHWGSDAPGHERRQNYWSKLTYQHFVWFASWIMNTVTIRNVFTRRRIGNAYEGPFILCACPRFSELHSVVWMCLYIITCTRLRRKLLTVLYIWIFIRHQPMTAKTDETEERIDT